MKVLFIGDVVGPPGLQALKVLVPVLRQSEQLDFVVANAENATNGSGCSPKDYKQIRACGVDAITLGDHIYKKFEISTIMKVPTEPLCKPANYPADAPGADHLTIQVAGKSLAVISLLGRTYMRMVDCPFTAVDRVLAKLDPAIRCIIVDIHAEATADKYLMLHHLKGRVSAVVGTHTHVQTADEQVFREGTAFLCDVGMTGPYDSILGRRVDRVLQTAVHFTPATFDVATDDVRLAGVIIEIDEATGHATSIRRVMESLPQ